MAEWRGRAEESSRQAQRDAARIELEIEMSEKKSQAHWTLQLEAKEVSSFVGILVCWSMFWLVLIGWLVDVAVGCLIDWSIG